MALVRHPERAQRNIRLVLLFGAGGPGVSPRSKNEPRESAVPLGGKGSANRSVKTVLWERLARLKEP